MSEPSQMPAPDAPVGFSAQMQELLAYVDKTPGLLSLLYDLNLMPEQLTFPSREGNIMIMLAAWHRKEFTCTEVQCPQCDNVFEV